MRALRQPQPGFGRGQPPCSAFNQPGAKTLLQRGDGPGHCRGGTSQFTTGGGQTAVLDHRHKNLQFVQPIHRLFHKLKLLISRLPDFAHRLQEYAD
ncbi:hypothetical protein D3C81_713030 [compost metagenome]